MKYKRWFWTTIFVTCLFMIPFIGIASFNYYVDPLWNFNHQNDHNVHQISFDERQLKVNYLAHNKGKYDTLLVGTSRTTYINQNDLTGMNAYNFSASSLDISEYGPYISYASQQNAEDFKTIVLEVYPFQYPGSKEFPDASVFIANNEAPFYKIKSLFSFDTFKKSSNNYTQADKKTPPGFRIYNRENVVSVERISEEELNANIQKGLSKEKTISTDIKSVGYTEALQKIKADNPNSQFIVYSPPYYYERTVKIFNSDAGLAYYRDWLEDCIEVFGGIVDFTTFNDISMEKDHYFDTHHFYPETGTKIANDIASFNKNDTLKYGTYVNEKNLEQFMQQFEQQMEEAATLNQ